jgi:SnoaL-like domain
MADPIAVVKDFDAAWNAHDIEGVLAFFTDDAVVRMEPPPSDEFGGVYAGKEQSLPSVRRFGGPATSLHKRPVALRSPVLRRDCPYRGTGAMALSL